MLYPLGGCRTQPLIDIRNIAIRNLNSNGGFLPQGVIRCNDTTHVLILISIMLIFLDGGKN